MQTGLKIAVVGASGAVGREVVEVLRERAFPVESLRLFAASSAGTEIDTGDEHVAIEELKEDSLDEVELALFCASSAVSANYARRAAEKGAVIIDSSSAFRMEQDVPLVVPEVNAQILRDKLRSKPESLIVASPNSAALQLTAVLNPILNAAGLKRVVVSALAAVSNAGKEGMDELWGQTLGIFNQDDVEAKTFPHQIAYNCIPQVDAFSDGACTKDELSIIQETRKILRCPGLRIAVTSIQAPVFVGSSQSVNIETERLLSADDARELLAGSPGIIVLDKPEECVYPSPVELAGSDAVYVGRIRSDDSAENGLWLWIVADNLRKGAALNIVQLAEIIVRERFPGK